MFMHKYPELDELDFEILILLKENGPLSEQEILTHFTKYESEEDVKSRLNILAKNKPDPNRSSFIQLGASERGFISKIYSSNGDNIGYEIDSKGSVAVSDYLYRKKILRKERRSSFLWRLTTILVAILAALGAIGAWRDEILRFFRFLFG